MDINEITKLAGRQKRRKRVGRGTGSGSGKTCGRGHKGCGARSGGNIRKLTEGGQMPLFRRIPKRGFNNANFRREYHIVNVSDLERVFDADAVVNAEALVAAGLIRNTKLPLKVLGNGEMSKKLTVEANKFSGQAQEKITKSGGQAKLV